MSIYDGLRNLEVPGRPRRSFRRVVKIALLTFLLGAVVVGSFGAYAFLKINGAIGQAGDEDIKVEAKVPGKPMNVLVLGSDRRDSVVSRRDRRQGLGGPSGQRADTIILVHISANAEKAVAVSFPRDLRVEIPGRGVAKINSAYSGNNGGPNLMIKTVSGFTGLDIHHYVEVNFNSFRSIVNALGGVRICVNRALRDEKANLNIPKAGCYQMRGNTALAYVRARNVDPTADIGRIQRQQQFLRALVREAKSLDLLFSPGNVNKLADALSSGLVTDTKVDLGLLRGIAGKLGGNPRKVDFRIVPGTPRYIGGVSYVVPNEEEAAAVFAALANGTRLPPYGKTSASVPKRADVTLKLMNGSGIDGLARREQARLRSKGYRVPVIGTSAVQGRTTIVYVPGAELKAELLQREYRGAVLQVATTELGYGIDVVVTLGRDRAPSPSPSS